METPKARRWLITFSVTLPMLFATSVFAKFAPALERRTFHTEHFRIHYPPHYQAFAERLADRLEEATVFLQDELQWAPHGKIEVVVRADTDVPNGVAEVFPYNRLVIHAVPPEAWGFAAETDDWIRTLAIHELTHVLANDETFGFFNVLRSFIGSAAKMNPYQPSWLVEGLAVYEETTKTSRGRGRAIWSDMVLRTAMKDSLLGTSEASGRDLKITLDRLNDGVRPWPGAHTPYLFGYVLTKIMADRGGGDTPARISKTNGARFPFLIEGVANETFGMGYDDLWKLSTDRLNRIFIEDMKRIGGESITAFTRLTKSGRRTRGFTPVGEHHYFIRDSENEGTGISVLEKGRARDLTYWRWDGGTRLRSTPDGRYLLYSRLAPYLEHSLFSDIYLYDLQSGKETQLTQGARASDPEPSSDFSWDSENGKITQGQIFYVKNTEDGNQAIVALIGASTEFSEKELFRGKNFARLGAPALGRGIRKDWLAFSIKEANEGERIEAIRLGSSHEDLESRSLTKPISISEVASTPVWESDGSLLYTGGTGGVFNLFRIQAAEFDALVPRAERITNSDTGVLQPSSSQGGKSLYAMVYGSAGWDLARVELGKFSANGPGLATLDSKLSTRPEVLAVRSFNVPEAPRSPESYSVLPALWPKYWAPDIRKVNDGWTAGVQTSGYDAWENHRYHLFAGVDTRASFPIWNFNGQFDGFYPTLEVSLRRENRYFATYRESNQIDTNAARVYMPAGWDSNVILGLTGTTSRFFQEKESTGGFEIGWTFDRMKTYDSSIDRRGESGVRGLTELTGYFVGKERFSSFDSRFEARVPAFFPRHFFRIGANYAKANNARLTSLYYLGGGEETIAGTADFLLRGYAQGTIYGREILTSNFEYLFPVADVFQGFGTFPAFFESSRVKLFFDAGSAEYVANDSRGFRRWPNAVGAHFLSDFNLLYRVPVTLGIGFDHGLARDLGGENRIVFGLFSSLP